ncbi:MAG: GTP-binding protein [Pseudomonadota bacterium]|nr:GTP-binding protein [Pseudomonadota bacterium]
MTSPSSKVNRIPALLLTGFLGAGKTTLLRTLLALPQDGDTAVIVNEFGEVGLDHHLLVGSSETMYVLENGCVCCTQREDLEASLEELFWARMRREVPRFARVVVETTGLADPTGVLRMVTGNTLAGNRYEWKSVVTLVDGLTGSETLEAHAAATQQAAMADHLVISKADLANAEYVEDLSRRLKILNPDARLHQAVDGALELSLGALLEPPPGVVKRRLGLLSGNSGAPPHNTEITSCWVQFIASPPRPAFEAVFAAMLVRLGPDILRAKGIASFAGEAGHSILQYVVGGALVVEAGSLPQDPSRPSGIVVIGFGLTASVLEDLFAAHGLDHYLIAENRDGYHHSH